MNAWYSMCIRLYAYYDVMFAWTIVYTNTPLGYIMATYCMPHQPNKLTWFENGNVAPCEYVHTAHELCGTIDIRILPQLWEIMCIQ